MEAEREEHVVGVLSVDTRGDNNPGQDSGTRTLRKGSSKGKGQYQNMKESSGENLQLLHATFTKYMTTTQ